MAVWIDSATMTIWRRIWYGRSETTADAAVELVDEGPGIGERLRDRRRARGLTLADVERDTRINPLYLEALEDGDFEALPAPVYARGFMRSYARYLGLDPDEAASAVPHDLPRPTGLEPLPGLRHTTSVGVPALNLSGLALVIAGVLLVAAIIAIALVAPRLRGGGDAAVPTPAATAGSRGAAPPLSPAGSTITTVPPFVPGTAPDFTGLPRDSALQLLDQLKLKSAVIEANNAAVTTGRVFDQTPAPGATLRPTDVVTLFVSRGVGN